MKRLALFACLAMLHCFAMGQTPVRFVIGFTPGGPSDILARSLAEKVSGPLGQPVVVQDRPGVRPGQGFCAGGARRHPAEHPGVAPVGARPRASSGAGAGAHLADELSKAMTGAREIPKWTKVVRVSGAKAE